MSKRYGSEDKGLFVDVRDDGLYLIRNGRTYIDPGIAKNPSILFADTGAIDVNTESLTDLLNENRDFEVKISEHGRFAVRDEDLEVIVASDKMSAKIAFIPGHPWFGAKLSAMDIVHRLKSAGVVFGVMTDVLNSMQTYRPPAGASVDIALGRIPVNGTDGELKYNFDVTMQSGKPKLLDNGSVDYKNVEGILKVKAGDILVEIADTVAGVDGVNVLGERIPHRPGKPSQRLPKGKNTTISEDGKYLISDIDGQIQINNNRVDVVSVLTISGDVGYETGNVDFPGSVRIEGTVLHGFCVKALGDVEVIGALEGAQVESGGNISMPGGVKGVGISVITAKGDIYARYVERATLIAGGDIRSDSIMHSSVRCGGHLSVEGKKGLLVGGTIYAGKSVTAKIIGSSMATATEITVGNSPDFIFRYQELEAAYKKVKDDYDKERLIEAYKAANEDLKLRSLHARIHLRVEMDKIQKEMNELLVLMNSTDGVVKASQIINCGCKIIVGGVLMKVTDELIACTLRNKDGRVSVGPYISY